MACPPQAAPFPKCWPHYQPPRAPHTEAIQLHCLPHTLLVFHQALPQPLSQPLSCCIPCHSTPACRRRCWCCTKCCTTEGAARRGTTAARCSACGTTAAAAAAAARAAMGGGGDWACMRCACLAAQVAAASVHGLLPECRNPLLPGGTAAQPPSFISPTAPGCESWLRSVAQQGRVWHRIARRGEHAQ